MSEEPRILVYDVFAKERNKGNPAGVILQADTMGQKQMQRIAYELGYNETAFVCQSLVADYRIRFFTLGQEVPMCGHATIAWKLGIRTPKAHRIIMEDNRQGIIYDQIVGEVLSEKISESSELVYDEWMDRFVNFHKQLMQHNIDDAMSYKDFLKIFATDDKAITKINALDDGNCFLHGDFHLKNVMLDENNQLVVIDMMNVCKGPELYDVARTYFLLNYDSNIQRKYIEKIGYSVEDIMPYLDVILMVRENEMRGTNI